MNELLGTGLFLAAVTLSADKINEDFGNAGMRGYGLLLILTCIYAGGVGVPYL